jgi:hypothetical protein
MAYYSPELVERIRLIKELQSRHFMPLKTIKKILEDEKAASEIRAYLYARPMAPGSDPPNSVKQSRIISDTGLSEDALQEMEEVGFIQVREDEDGDLSYEPPDVSIIHAVAAMNRAGLSPDKGFVLEDIVFYQKAMRELLTKELAVFSRVMGKASRSEIIGMARAGIEGSNVLMMALRRKLFLELVGDEMVGEVLPKEGRKSN